MTNLIIYEQPVYENIRNFLKCEYINEKFISSFANNNLWGIKVSILALIEMAEFNSRYNLKVDLIMDLEKKILYLKELKKNNSITEAKYIFYQSEIKKCILNLLKIKFNPSKTVNNNDFLMSIKHKFYITAGGNFFDMPSLLSFLTSKRSSIKTLIKLWYEPFEVICESCLLSLDIKRSTSPFLRCTSNFSFYSQKLTKNFIDLVRVKVLTDKNIFPDISANSKNVNIIFKELYKNENNGILSRAIDDNFIFEIALCGLN